MGYLIEKARPTIFWKPTPHGPRPMSVAHDFHGAFDLNGIHAILPDLHVQVTSHDHRAARKRKVAGIVDGRSANPHHLIEVWSYGYQKELGHHRHVERFVSDKWVFIGDYRYDGTVIREARPSDVIYTGWALTLLPSSPTKPTEPTDGNS